MNSNKKRFGIFFVMLVVLINVLNISVIAYSDDIKSGISDDTGELILLSETSTVLEDGTIMHERVYSSVNTKARGVSGSGTFRNETELEFSDGTAPLKCWVQGVFSWNSESDYVTVTNRVYGHSTVPSKCSINNERKTYGNNQGMNFLLGRKYAYIRYTFVFENMFGFQRNVELYLDVNVDGVSSHN